MDGTIMMVMDHVVIFAICSLSKMDLASLVKSALMFVKI